jgi:FKBP-type peptidyl-prolyl cis-trans isomerase
LEKKRLESIAENAIATGAPDVNSAVLVFAVDDASSAALLAMGIATKAQTTKELADNERDERARMTSVERAAKVVERDRKCAEKEAEEEAQRAAKAARDRKRSEKEAEKAQRQRVTKAAERDAKWTADVDAIIVRMVGGGSTFSKTASELGNVRHNQASCAWRVSK